MLKTLILFAMALLLAKPSSAHEFRYDVFLSGPPGNAMELHVNFAGLTGTVTASDIHCCTAVALTGTAGAATPFPGFPAGVTAGNFNALIDLTDGNRYNPAFIAASGGTAAGSLLTLLGRAGYRKFRV